MPCLPGAVLATTAAALPRGDPAALAFREAYFAARDKLRFVQSEDARRLVRMAWDVQTLAETCMQHSTAESVHAVRRLVADGLTRAFVQCCVQQAASLCNLSLLLNLCRSDRSCLGFIAFPNLRGLVEKMLV